MSPAAKYFSYGKSAFEKIDKGFLSHYKVDKLSQASSQYGV
jgi:hypothetical protein